MLKIVYNVELLQTNGNPHFNEKMKRIDLRLIISLM